MPDRALGARVDAVRAFNRFYTRRIGLLRKDYLGSHFSLTQARVLYEIARSRRPTASDLGRDLDLDPGYLSRILSGFAARGLLRRIPSRADRRQRLLVLTPRGRDAFAPLDVRSHDEIAAMLRRLPPRAQTRLVGAMRTIEALLDGPVSPLALEPPGRRSPR
ncbi:MAG TPA: MarR family transcriptional regulator [bacterium]|nr:MarR family transcriptional regulator [bacterium]